MVRGWDNPDAIKVAKQVRLKKSIHDWIVEDARYTGNAGKSDDWSRISAHLRCQACRAWRLVHIGKWGSHVTITHAEEIHYPGKMKNNFCLKLEQEQLMRMRQEREVQRKEVASRLALTDEDKRVLDREIKILKQESSGARFGHLRSFRAFVSCYRVYERFINNEAAIAKVLLELDMTEDMLRVKWYRVKAALCREDNSCPWRALVLDEE